MTTPNNMSTLTIAGSGIASIRHITLETLSYIENADKVYYVVGDPATEAFIKDKSKGECADLSVYYAREKNRYETYVQMCEVMLRDVRAGHNVLGIFYGHPGVFVSPSHRAIAIARREGYKAEMLAGVSAEDYMFSDLGFDPALPGCMTQEATALLTSGRQLDTTVHNIVWQVGSVGVANMAFDNAKFHLLVDHLEKTFGREHKVVHYIGAVLPQDSTVKDSFTIAQLRDEAVVKQFTTTSTLYIPPRDEAPVQEDVVQKLGIPVLAHRAALATADYGDYERAAVASLNESVPAADHLNLRACPGVRKFMTDLALQPDLLRRYKDDPAAVVDAVAGLSTEEKYALGLGKPGPVYAVMRGTDAEIAGGSARAIDDAELQPLIYALQPLIYGLQPLIYGLQPLIYAA